MRCIEPPFDIEQTRSFITQCGLCEPPLVYALALKSTGKVIGHAIYHALPDEPAWEIGWVLAREYWGRGLAGEVTAALTAHARAAGVPELLIECDPEQQVSAHIALKHGFADTGICDGLHAFRLKI